MMTRALVLAILLSWTAAAHAGETTKIGSGEPAEAILIVEGTGMKQLGKVRVTEQDEGGKPVQKPDVWVPGNVMIIREIDEQTAKHLKVTNGVVETGGAYRIRENHELEYVGKVDLNKSNQALAKQFGVKPEKRPKRNR